MTSSQASLSLPAEVDEEAAVQCWTRRQFTVLPAIPHMWLDLTRLNLSYNALESLPEEICQMKRLKILDVTHNQLTTLPRGIDRMTQLRQLYLSYNRLTCEAFAVEDMTSLPLQVLHLASNDLPDLPESFMAFQSSLEVLDVSYNALITLPEWLGQFERLSFLNIAHNRLRTITPALAGLTKLTCVLLQGNAFSNEIRAASAAFANVAALGVSDTSVALKRNAEEAGLAANNTQRGEALVAEAAITPQQPVMSPTVATGNSSPVEGPPRPAHINTSIATLTTSQRVPTLLRFTRRNIAALSSYEEHEDSPILTGTSTLIPESPQTRMLDGQPADGPAAALYHSSSPLPQRRRQHHLHQRHVSHPAIDDSNNDPSPASSDATTVGPAFDGSSRHSATTPPSLTTTSSPDAALVSAARSPFAPLSSSNLATTSRRVGASTGALAGPIAAASVLSASAAASSSASAVATAHETPMGRGEDPASELSELRRRRSEPTAVPAGATCARCQISLRSEPAPASKTSWSTSALTSNSTDAAESAVVTALGLWWHRDCFVCAICDAPLKADKTRDGGVIVPTTAVLGPGSRPQCASCHGAGISLGPYYSMTFFNDLLSNL